MQDPKYRLWTWKEGLYPRRVTIYLQEKGIEQDFEIVSVEMGHQGAGPAPGKPPGSVPILEIERSSSDDKLDGTYIRQTNAILEYLEDVYADRGPQMRGQTAKERAAVRDCMNVLNEAVHFMECYWHNASALFKGMEEQDEATARWALARYHRLLGQLERFAHPVGPFIAGGGAQPTIVDCVLLATAQFAKALYGDDIVAGHDRLAACIKAFEKRPSAAADFSGLPDFVKQNGPILSVR